MRCESRHWHFASPNRSKEALKLEEAVHERLPQRDLLDILTRTAYQTGWTRHLGPASGSDPKIKEALGRTRVLRQLTIYLGQALPGDHLRPPTRGKDSEHMVSPADWDRCISMHRFTVAGGYPHPNLGGGSNGRTDRHRDCPRR
ncbi:hypothetical protein OHA25_08380 [Nonomuraea sp. NBC_00507]|uniref:hypothetical protein n=1 Tax=Nonomuraea sp. NBC_00507 TaxID=2976002 RepID=UPI002E189282